jgi:hypothetical protein
MQGAIIIVMENPVHLRAAARAHAPFYASLANAVQSTLAAAR